MAIYLVRHGQTNANRDRVVQLPDTSLSDIGHQQAQRLAKRFEHIPISTIICSDYLRTQQTAEPLVMLRQIKIFLEPLLRERNFGDLRGKAYDDIDTDFFSEGYQPTNGESYLQFVERVKLAWKAVLMAVENSQGNTIVMTHGLVLREIIKQHLSVKDGVMPLSEFQNTCITEVDARDKKTVLKLCDASHLDEESIIVGAV